MDESAGRPVAEVLSRLGHDAAFVFDWKPSAEDDAVQAKALGEKRIIVTDDKDFGEMIFKKGCRSSGVVLVRFPSQAYDASVRAVGKIVNQHGSRLRKKFTVVTPGGVRIRQLPPR